MGVPSLPDFRQTLLTSWRRLRHQSPFLLNILLTSILLVWAWQYFRPLEQVVNIELYDETGDLWRALRQPIWAWPPEYGPLYPLWYRFLSLFRPDPLDLYYMSYRWVAILTPTALFVALRRLGVAPSLAFWAAGLLLVSQGHSRVWPRIPVFWALVFTSALAVVGRDTRRALWSRFWDIGWVLWWSSFVRPSFVLPALVFLAVGLLIGLRHRFTPRPERGRLLLWATGLFPLLIWGFPYQQDRLQLAFAQHFIVRRAEMGDPIPDPWVETWRIREYFPRPESFWTMLRDRPDLIWTHVRGNLEDMYRIFFDSFSWKNIYLVQKGWRIRKYLLYIFLLPGWLGIPLLFTAGTWRQSLLLLLLSGAVVGISLINALVIFPHPHYLYPAWVAGLIAFAIFLGRSWEIYRDNGFSWRLLYWGTFLLTLFAAYQLWGDRDVRYWIPQLKDPSRRVVYVARFVRQLPLPKDRTLYALGVDGEWFVYFGSQFEGLDDAYRASRQPLLEYLQSHDVALIVMGDERLCRPATEDCEALLAHPERWGFVRLDAPLANGGRLPILVRADLLPQVTPPVQYPR